MNRYKRLDIQLTDELQTYVVESHIEARNILMGEEEGVVCHMVDSSKTDAVVDFLNDERSHGDH